MSDTQSRPLTQLTLRDRHAAAGAKFAPFAGWEMPLQYEGIVAEHHAVRERAGVFDVSHLARAWVEGPDAASLLRSVTTFDVTSLPEGRASYSLYCNADGGIADDVFIYHLSGDRWLVIHNAANAEADFERLRSVAGDAAAERTSGSVMLAVQGPHALGILETVLGPRVAALAPRDCAEISWRGAQILIARTGYTGEDGGECIVEAALAGELWDALIANGVQRPDSARATRCGSRPRCPCTVTTSTPQPIPSRRASGSRSASTTAPTSLAATRSSSSRISRARAAWLIWRRPGAASSAPAWMSAMRPARSSPSSPAARSALA